MELERATEENAEGFERKLIFASLDDAVRVEAEQIWQRMVDEFRERGGARPSTDFVISLARDTVSRKVEEAQAVQESMRMAAEAEMARAAAAESEAEATLIKERASEDRRARAARFAAAFDRRQQDSVGGGGASGISSTGSSSSSSSSSKKSTPG